MTHTAKCEICNKDYDNEFRITYIQRSSKEADIKCCCGECLEKEITTKPHWFRNYLPAYYDGGSLTTTLFDTKEELIEWLHNNIKISSDEVLCTGSSGYITAVNKSGKHWWVAGLSTLGEGDLPNRQETAERFASQSQSN